VKILLNDKAELEKLFVCLGINGPKALSPPDADSDLILPDFRKLIQLPSLPDRVVHWVQGRKMGSESNSISWQ
jgi:hypothetical protein